MKRFERAVVVGSVGFDRIMNLPGKFSDWIMPEKIHQLNVSFTVESLRVEFGGTGGNCAYSLGLLQKKPFLVGFLGMDGGGYTDFLESNGVKIKWLQMDKALPSACGHVMTDLSNNQIWSYYPGPLVRMKDINLQMVMKPHDFFALLPSEPKAFRTHLRELVKIGARFMFDPAFFIPNLSKTDLLMGIANAEIIIGNDYEIALIEKKANQIIRNQLTKTQVLVKTLGEKGSEIYTKEKVINIPPASVKKVVDPTGAGDAYRAGFLAGYMEGLDLIECGKMGAVAAAYSIEKYGTQTHHFDLIQFRRRLLRFHLSF